MPQAMNRVVQTSKITGWVRDPARYCWRDEPAGNSPGSPGGRAGEQQTKGVDYGNCFSRRRSGRHRFLPFGELRRQADIDRLRDVPGRPRARGREQRAFRFRSKADRFCTAYPCTPGPLRPPAAAGQAGIPRRDHHHRSHARTGPAGDGGCSASAGGRGGTSRAPVRTSRQAPACRSPALFDRGCVFGAGFLWPRRRLRPADPACARNTRNLYRCRAHPRFGQHIP